ncbi:MAG: DASS family sodium-coupled anion symporter [Armatimonadetes bacterium]|nr:MAG: DASS family sodium-coupled anion symporter [Armatimonadota bacterium]
MPPGYNTPCVSKPVTSRTIKVAAAVGAFALAWFAGTGLPEGQQPVGAVFALTVVLWVTEALPLTITALLSTALLVLIAGIDEKQAFAGYGDPIVPLFIGSFLLAKAMEVTGLSERIAWWILNQRWASGSPSRLLLALGIIGCLISLVVSNTATTAMMLPIGLGLLKAMGVEQRSTGFAIAVMLMLTWGSSVAVGFPVGTPPNLIGIAMIERSTGTRIGFVEWMQFSMPLTAIMTLASWGVLRAMYRRGDPPERLSPDHARVRLSELGKMSPAERNTLLAFVAAIVLWMTPDLAVFALGKGAVLAAWLQGHLTAAVTALLVGAMLFLLPTKGAESGTTLTWKQGASIDWGTIMLFGGGIVLGQAMFSSGLAETLGKAAAQATGVDTMWGITALGILAAVILSEMASNTASASTLLPVVIGIAQGAGVNPIPPALGVALGASFGFMLPVSTAPNAIVYSSGLVPMREMMRSGVVLDLLGAAATFACLRVILPLIGLA